MLFDTAFHIVGHIGCYHYAVLGAAVHGLRIYIIVVGIVGHEPSVVLKSAEILYSLVIHALVMFISAGLEINLGFDDMVERHGIAVGLGAGFFGVKHIIGARSHLGD